jgi:hypothetical protein
MEHGLAQRTFGGADSLAVRQENGRTPQDEEDVHRALSNGQMTTLIQLIQTHK